MAGALETRTAAGWLPGWQAAHPRLYEHLDAGHFPDGEMTKFEFFESLCFIDAERRAFHTKRGVTRMAICEVCGEEVAPGDMVVIERKSQPHFFCSTFHRDDWIEADESPGRTRPVTKEEASEAGRVLEAAPEQVTVDEVLAEEPKVKARVVATGHKVTAAEMKAREAAEKAAAKDAAQPTDATVPPVKRRTRKKS